MEAKRVFTVQNKFGIHARPAYLIVQTGEKFQSDVTIIKKDSSVGTVEINGKSIMGVMMLGAAKGQKLLFITKGPDCEELLDAFQEVFDNKFNEE